MTKSQRIMVTALAGIITAGVAAISHLLITTNQIAVRTENTVNHLKQDFDSFQDIRYQQDMDQLGTRMAQYESRLDRIVLDK